MQDKEPNIQKLYRTNLYYLKTNEGQSVNCTLRHLWPVYNGYRLKPNLFKQGHRFLVKIILILFKAKKIM